MQSGNSQQQADKANNPLYIVARRLSFPFLFSQPEALAALQILMPPSWETSDISNSLPEKLTDLHATVLRFMVFYHDTNGIYTSEEDSKLALKQHVIEHKILPLAIIDMLLCPKYLDTLFRLPKPFARIHHEEGFLDVEWGEQFTLHLDDKVKQLDWSLYLMGIKNLTPPAQPTTYQTILKTGARFVNIFTESAANFSEIYGMFASKFAAGNVQAVDEPQHTPGARLIN
jgi:hypothetical protein